MKKLFLMLAVVGTIAFASCSADKETQAKQEEANKEENIKKEAGDMPEFDEDGNEIKKEDKKEDNAAPKNDSTAKTDETKVEKP